MKYIVVAVTYKVRNGEEVVTESVELPIVFPDKLVHADMSEGAILAARLGTERWESTKIVGAGFITFGADGVSCYGKSESLGVKSREKVDRDLITKTFYS